MPTNKDIINMGLGKIGASRVNNLTPPISTLEIKCAAEFPQWRTSELKKRRWVFATAYVTLSALITQVPADDRGRTYKFQKPGDYLRGIRQPNCTWIERGQALYDVGNTINLEYIRDVTNLDITDPLFIDVLAARVAVECVELASQSPAKKRDALVMLKDAEEEAGRMNAFVLEPHALTGDDMGYTWEVARRYPSMGQ